MLDEKYEFVAADSEDYFEFISMGTNGSILKTVQFTLIDKDAQLYNLGMGDIEPKSGEIIDNIISNNKDTQKILSTIGEIGRWFLEHKPGASILIEGNSSSRNRLYRMGINKYLDIWSENFAIFGLKEQNHEWERFINNSNYIAFIISKNQ
jgi:hypothetical protein